jgi:ABC-type antimicrobial peptide transport system permease subunit
MVLGVIGAVAVTPLLGTMVFQVQPYDPLTYAGGLVFLSAVTFVACYIPASRAARIDPLKPFASTDHQPRICETSTLWASQRS